MMQKKDKWLFQVDPIVCENDDFKQRDGERGQEKGQLDLDFEGIPDRRSRADYIDNDPFGKKQRTKVLTKIIIGLAISLAIPLILVFVDKF